MLLARLQRQDVGAFPFRVDRFADQAARDFAEQLLRNRHKTEVRPAETHRVAERLTVADRNIGAPFARRLEHRQRDRVDRHNRKRADALRRGDYLPDAFQVPEEVRVLDNDRGDVLRFGGQDGVQRVQVDDPVFLRNDAGFEEPGRGVSLDDASVIGVQRRRNQDDFALRRFGRHNASLRERAPAAVHRRVRDVHPGQAADRRLIFEDRLQNPLADLRLVRRVRGNELRTPDDRVDGGRNVVIVATGAEEDRRVVRRVVRQREFFQLPPRRHFRRSAALRQQTL